eukprot:scaffold973_cov399-Prasinococcus_capsulatus_cf.AAC.24
MCRMRGPQYRSAFTASLYRCPRSNVLKHAQGIMLTWAPSRLNGPCGVPCHVIVAYTLSHVPCNNWSCLRMYSVWASHSSNVMLGAPCLFSRPAQSNARRPRMIFCKASKASECILSTLSTPSMNPSMAEVVPLPLPAVRSWLRMLERHGRDPFQCVEAIPDKLILSQDPGRWQRGPSAELAVVRVEPILVLADRQSSNYWAGTSAGNGICCEPFHNVVTARKEGITIPSVDALTAIGRPSAGITDGMEMLFLGTLPPARWQERLATLLPGKSYRSQAMLFSPRAAIVLGGGALCKQLPVTRTRRRLSAATGFAKGGHTSGGPGIR